MSPPPPVTDIVAGLSLWLPAGAAPLMSSPCHVTALTTDHESKPTATVCAALKDACDEIQAGFKVRMTLLRQFERYAAVELERVYHELNSHLVERRVLPEVRPGMPRASALRKCKTTQTARAARSAQSLEAQQPEPVLAALAQLLGVSLGDGEAAAFTRPIDAAPAPETFVAELTRMHREDDASAGRKP